MSPHEQAEEFIASYTKLMHEDTDISNFQKVLEMKVRTQLCSRATQCLTKCITDHL